MVLVISRFRVANGRESSVRDAFLARPRLVDSAPGFLGIETFTDARQPEIFYLVTRWTDEASYRTWHSSDRHRESHAFIPEGLKLDATYTTLTVADRLEDTTGAGAAAEQVVADAAVLLQAHVSDAQTLYCFVAAVDGTIHYCNSAGAAVLGKQPGELHGQPLWPHLTEPDAAALRTLVSTGARDPQTARLLNFVTDRQLPFTVRCRVDVHGARFVLLGEPDSAGLTALQANLLQMNNQFAVMAREYARQKKELEQSNWQLRKIGELLPFCMACGKVKGGEGDWQELARFLQERSEFLSHGYCPACAARVAAEWELK